MGTPAHMQDVKLNPLAKEFVRSPAPAPSTSAEATTELAVDPADKFVSGLDLVHNLGSHASWLASMISTLPEVLAGQVEGGVICSRCETHAASKDTWAEEIRSMRDGWMWERWEHTQTSLRVEELRALVDACDAAYRAISFSHGGMFANGTPLSQIARDTIASHCDMERERAWKDAREATEKNTKKLKQRSKGLLQANKKYIEFARKLNDEFQKYERWLEERSTALQRNHVKYCEIMMEQGAEPELLYCGAENVKIAREAYIGAWSERQKMARQAVETAYLDGAPDMFEGIDDV